MTTERARRLTVSEDGSVLIVTIAVTGILSLLVTVAFSVARHSMQVAQQAENSHGALAAAEAGLDDYIFRINSVDEYWRYDHVTTPPDANTAFVADALSVPVDDPAWTPIAGGTVGLSDGREIDFGEYVYSVDTDDLESEGVVRVTATGRVVAPGGGAQQGVLYDQRSVTATIKQNSFLDYLYFTDFETLDPVAYSTAADEAWAEVNCSVHRWVSERPDSGRPSNRGAGCLEITWAIDDSVDGPFHTNDRWRISGSPTWYGDVSGSAIDLDFYTGSGSPNFLGGDPFYQAPLEMPPSNSALKDVATFDGCVYTGPTSIIMQSNGTLRIDSPYTRSANPGCGTFSGSGNDAPQTVALPGNGVIYVQAIPASTSDPNYTSGCPFGDNGLGYPVSYSSGGRFYADDDETDYSCRDGDAFVEGTLDGRLTVATENDVVITWHLLYQGTDDMLGLIANDFVQIYHPVDRSQSTSRENMQARPNHNQEFRNPQINAAILSVSHSFLVQDWAYGDNGLGTIDLNGAIAQIYRGPVGTFSGSTQVSGYDKDYDYDERLRYTNPPHFIDPVSASWRILQFAEQL